LRIAIIIGPYYPVPTLLGGAVEKIQLRLAEAYAAAGHEVTIISRQFGELASEEIIAQVRHIRIPSFDRARSNVANFLHDLIYSRRAAKIAPKADVTVTNGFSLPLFLSRRRAGRIYVHVARFPKRQFFLYWKADRFQAVSSAVARAIGRQTPSLAKKVVTIANPLPAPYFRDETKNFTVLFVGRIAREKGVHLLIEAFHQATQREGCDPRWQLRIVGSAAFEHGGDGPAYLGELKQIAAPLGRRCQFIGPIFDEAALIGEYAAAAIFAYPSLASKGEAFGLAPLEAMAAGCAVIVSNLECFEDYVRNGANALQFDILADKPIAHLADNLAVLMADGDKRVKLGAAARSQAKAFGLPVIAHRMLEDFECLLRQ
jgi:glycosyltransferase involved in cell wall biosynthesis